MGMGYTGYRPEEAKGVSLTKEELARHLVEREGRCQMNGKYCYPHRCPINGRCMGMDKLDWALSIMLGGDGGDTSSAGRCKDIW